MHAENTQRARTSSEAPRESRTENINVLQFPLDPHTPNQQQRTIWDKVRLLHRLTSAVSPPAPERTTKAAAE